MQQNDVPIVHQLRVANVAAHPLEDILIRLSSEPELFPAWETTISHIPTGGAYELGPIDLRLSASLLIGLTERLGAQIRARAARDGQVLAEQVEPIEMLAFDEWNGLGRSLPELLAAFVLPNHPVVEGILSDAAHWLGEQTGDCSMSGYQSRSPARAGHIAQAIFAAIQARGIHYCNPPASFESTGQKIRLPDRIIEHKLATCLDLAALAAACLEQAGLFPLIVITKGHAFAGVWLIEECFADRCIDDLPLVRKRIDLNEILVFETTLTTLPPPNDFTTAVAAAKRHLAAEDEFHCAIDIQRCRKGRIRPLPTRIASEAPSGTDSPIGVSTAGAVFELPALTPSDSGDKSAAQTPETRLDKWKRKLLDLTLHNRLINFKQSKKTAPLLCPDLGMLEDALADGLDFQVLARPAEFGADTQRSAELHRVRTGADGLDELLAAEFQSRRLRTALTDEELPQQLTEIYRAARTAMEEGGASALYIALGFLVWFEAETAEQRRLAPIILLPVELRRKSAQEGFRVCQGDEDPRINITLLELLAKDFGLRIPNMDPIPQDERGIDVRGILTAFRQAIKRMPRWDVIEEAHIGFFSFTKFLMWRDLEQRTGELLRNKVVDHLVHRPHERFPDEGGFPVAETLDETHRPQETFCPLPSDSSQLAAVYAAASGKSFVLFGPPGTGKSQTITNLIAHSLAKNKSVLFVSDKMAALEVVHRRLTQCGLGPFCLELHSNKTHKRHVIEQLGAALDYHAGKAPQEWDRQAERLASLRSDLNGYVQALHQPRSFGESMFQATSRLIGLRDIAPVDLELSHPDSVTREQLERWREAIDRIKTAAGMAGHPASSVWSTCGIASWSPAIQRSIESDIDAMHGLCERLDACIRKLGPPLGLDTSWDLAYLEVVDRLVRLLTASPRPTSALLSQTDWEATEASINEWIANGRKRDQLRRAVHTRYDDLILDLHLDGLATRLAGAKASWFLPRWLGVRAVRKALAGVARQRERRNADGLADDLRQAQALRDEEKRLADAGERARALLGQYWNGGEADWNAIEAVRDWSGQFRRFAYTAADGELQRAASLRQHWTRLVTEGRESLQPGGKLDMSIAEFLALHAEFAQLDGALNSKLAGAPTIWGAPGQSVSLADVRAKLAGWKSRLAELRAWCNWRQVRREAVEAGLETLVAAYEKEGIAADELRSRFDRAFYEAFVDSVTEQDKVLRGFFSAEHERKIRRFREVDESYTDLTKGEIQARVAAYRPVPADRVHESSEMGILQRQRQLRRGHIPVRQLFQKIPHLLHRLKPCVLMSPISVAQYLDASHPPFDLVVFDEASQIPVWDAIGAIARGKEVIVVGDPKQLPPTSFFMRTDEQERGDDDLPEEMESILDECLSAQFPQMPLRWHYRSRHESLIAFSNFHYYENKLLTFPACSLAKGVSYRHVPQGAYDKGRSRTNRTEAEAVVAEVVRRLRDPDLGRRTIGVVTFSIAQQGLVEDLLDEARRRHPEIEPFFGGDCAEPVFVKNLENVQGDERDVILFSVCYGPDAAGRVSMNFGPLNRDGGERRLNVAITRARHEVLVFAVLRAEHIDLSRTRARGVADLKRFLDYAERGPSAMAHEVSPHGGDSFDSPFEEAVCQKLRERGHIVHTQVGCSGYRIDLGVVDPQTPSRYLLGIECDGANYHSAKTARDRDRLRASVLAGLGWRLHRVWSSDWWADPQACLAAIDAAIEQAKTAGAAPAAPPTPATDLAHVLAAMPEGGAGAQVLEVDREDEPAIETEREAEHEPGPAGPPTYSAYPMKRLLGSPREFYLAGANRAIKRLIQEIVRREGPVALEVVGRRVANHWGIGRLGANIRERIDRIARAAAVTIVQHGEAVYLWPADLDVNDYCAFRLPGIQPDDQRDIDEIPPEEIAGAAVHVLRQQVSLPMEALIRETAAILGFQRAGKTIQRIVETALAAPIERGRIHRDSAGRARLG